LRVKAGLCRSIASFFFLARHHILTYGNLKRLASWGIYTGRIGAL
jgi:hypothetical protein